MNCVVSEKGQITIPKALRNGLGIAQGTVLSFTEEDGKLVGRKVLPEDPFAKWRGRGRIPGGATVDEYLRDARGGA